MKITEILTNTGAHLMGMIKENHPAYEGGGIYVRPLNMPSTHYDDDHQYFCNPCMFGIDHGGKLTLFELRPGGMSYTYLNPNTHTEIEINEFLKGTTRAFSDW